MERTLIIFKPDCVQRRLTGRVLARFEDKGLNPIAIKMMRITPALSKQHYAEHVSKPFYPALESFITGAPVIVAVTTLVPWMIPRTSLVLTLLPPLKSVQARSRAPSG